MAKLKKRIAVAFIHGSVARSAEKSSSDVDLIVIGDLGLADVTPVLEKAEARVDRSVNASVYTPQEFSKKLAAKNHFLTSILEKEKIFILGGYHDLEKIAGVKPRPDA